MAPTALPLVTLLAALVEPAAAGVPQLRGVRLDAAPALLFGRFIAFGSRTAWLSRRLSIGRTVDGSRYAALCRI